MIVFDYMCVDTHAVVSMEAPEAFAFHFLAEFNTKGVQPTRQHKPSKAFLDVVEISIFEVDSVYKSSIT